MRMPICCIAKTSHTVRIENVCCFVSGTVIVALMVLVIVGYDCVGFNKNILSCFHSLLLSLLLYLDERIINKNVLKSYPSQTTCFLSSQPFLRL